MKKLALTFAMLCAACAFTFAGPEPMASGKDKVVQVPVVETPCFEGWYFGVHGGGIWANLNTDTAAYEETVSARGNFESDFDFSGTDDKTTGEGGLHAGYNWVRGGWVFGFEADISGTNLNRRDSATAFIPLGQETSFDDGFAYVTNIESKTALDWYSTFRPRFGHTLGQRVFIFGTGGLAFGLTEVSQTTSVFAATPGGATGDVFNTSDRGIQFGWTVGGGLEFCLSQHWILNFTYLYVDLGDRDGGSSFSGSTNTEGSEGERTYFSQTVVSSDMKFHVFQGGLSFRF